MDTVGVYAWELHCCLSSMFFLSFFRRAVLRVISLWHRIRLQLEMESHLPSTKKKRFNAHSMSQYSIQYQMAPIRSYSTSFYMSVKEQRQHWN